MSDAVQPPTVYRDWTDGSNPRVEDSVAAFLGEFAADYDFPDLVAAYREAIDGALPDGVSLHGDEFYGPYPKPQDADERIADAVASVDLGALAEKFDTTRED